MLFLAQWLVGGVYVWSTSGKVDDLIIGAAIATAPTTLVVLAPGARRTRYAIAVAQMLYGGLFVHVTGGAFGTAGHAFASLALLALYRSPGVILAAAGVVVLEAAIAPGVWAQHLVWVGVVALVQRQGLRPRHSHPRHGPRRLGALRARLRGRFWGPGGRVPVSALVVPRVVDMTEVIATAPTLRPRAHQELSIYSDLEGDEDMHELLDGFVERLRQIANELERPSSPAELEQIAQRLRGAAAGYGFASISEAACARREP
ncbi:MAG: hypothetical protein KIT84_14355 [Labilithrix sp.]|nr:hypothetical protein [Labilithrix sp.]MCW5812204.1 hypothetical protein [Labilithrix sp.]